MEHCRFNFGVFPAESTSPTMASVWCSLVK
jgi:hypothetical protein